MVNRPLGTLSALLLMLASPAFAGPMDDGIAAHERHDFTSALASWQPLADAGNAEAQDRIGLLYANGEGVTQDQAKAAVWFRKAADQGNADSEWHLSLFYLRGDGPLPKDVPTGLTWLRKATDQNFANADFTLATVYSVGFSSEYPKDGAKAVEWWREAADQGMPEAMYQLGRAYSDGRGIPQDQAQAAIWYRKAAEKNYQAAEVGLGRLYALGVGVELDKEQALFWLRKAEAQGGASGDAAEKIIAGLQTPPPALAAAANAVSQAMNPRVAAIRSRAEQGDAASESTLGDFYSIRGNFGSQEDAAQAIAWWKKAAEQGYTRAMNQLADAYMTGILVPRDTAESTAWRRKAVEKDDALAEMALGNAYADGNGGVPKDKEQAIVWFRKAEVHGGLFHGMAETAIARLDQKPKQLTPIPADFDSLLSRAALGDVEAEARLGLIYADENSEAKDYKEAAAWLTKAAQKGNADAMSALAGLYFLGLGVPRDMAQYIYWLKQAANHERVDDEITLSNAYATGMFGVPQDDAQSVAWLQAAAEQGSAKAQVQLATLYEFGQKVPKDDTQALFWLKKATDQHDCRAEQLMAERYELGINGPRDLDQARAWYVKAVDHPFTDNCQNFAEASLKSLDERLSKPH